MSPDAGPSSTGVWSEPVTVRVEHDARGAWSVAMPGDGGAVTCETFDDARPTCAPREPARAS
jgi:hypothetical protein